MTTDIIENANSATVTAGGTTVPAAGTSESWIVDTAADFTELAAGQVMRIIDKADAIGRLTGYEIMEVTANANGVGASWTVTRGAEGTTPYAHAPGWTAVPAITSGGLDGRYPHVGTYVGPAAQTPAVVGSPRVQYFDPLNYGVDPTGSVLADTQMAECISDAMAVAGKILVRPNMKIRISETLLFQSGLSGATTPVPYASFVGGMPPGRIGDSTDDSSCEIICDSTFPSGSFAISYKAPNTNCAPSGFELKNLGVKCESLGAGVYIEQPRMAKVGWLSIDHTAAPAGSPNGATGAFSVPQLNGTASAYSQFEHICTGYAGQDGFFHNCAGEDRFDNCYDLNAIAAGFRAYGDATWTNCHYEASAYGWIVQCGGVQNTLIGCSFFGLPALNALQLVSSYTSGWNNSFKAIGCQFAVQPTSFVNTSVPVFITGGGVVLAQFISCDFVAYGDTEYWVTADPAAGSIVQVGYCNFTGTVNNGPYLDSSNCLRFHDCTGINPVGVVTPTVPGGTGGVVTAVPYDRMFYCTGDATDPVTFALSGGPTITLPAGGARDIHLKAGLTFTTVQTSGHPPTWVVEGE